MSGNTGYAEIATYFRQQIADGTLAPGDKMPTQKQVREQFGASIATVNRAFQMLKAEGLTAARVGQGTTVAERPRVASTATARLRRISRTGRAYGPRERSVDHDARLLSCADSEVADELGIDLHDEILVRRRVYMQGDVRTIASFSFIHPRGWAAVPEILSSEPMGRFWQKDYMERTGRTTVKLPERRGARLAYPYELSMLGVDAPPNAAVPVLVLLNTWHDEDGPLEHWQDVFAPGLYQVDEE
ncbi:GntR family transcriptional regulator [Streptomyces sp. NPDC008222]|uniref:GntR family transcriptional regulator n=1 Tax=Streptomyces sp. NPDC008222 TaxID=3364820 RepID=UPI0036E60356